MKSPVLKAARESSFRTKMKSGEKRIAPPIPAIIAIDAMQIDTKKTRCQLQSSFLSSTFLEPSI